MKKSASVCAAETSSNETREWTCRTCDQVFSSMSEFCVHEVSHLSLLNPELAPSIANAYLEQAERLAGRQSEAMKNKSDHPLPGAKTHAGHGRPRLSSLRSSVSSHDTPSSSSSSPPVTTRRKRSSSLREKELAEPSEEAAQPAEETPVESQIVEEASSEPEAKRPRTSDEGSGGAEAEMPQTRRSRARIALPPSASSLNKPRRGRVSRIQSKPPVTSKAVLAPAAEKVEKVSESPKKEPTKKVPAKARKPVHASPAPALGSSTSKSPKSTGKPPVGSNQDVPLLPKPVNARPAPVARCQTSKSPQSAGKPSIEQNVAVRPISAAKMLFSSKKRRRKPQAPPERPRPAAKRPKIVTTEVQPVVIENVPVRECKVVLERLKLEDIQKLTGPLNGKGSKEDSDESDPEAVTVGSIRITKRPKAHEVASSVVQPRINQASTRRTYVARESKRKGILRQVRAEQKQKNAPSTSAGWYFSEFRPSSPQASDVFDRIVEPPAQSAANPSAADGDTPAGNESLGDIQDFLLETADPPAQPSVLNTAEKEDEVTTTTVTAADSTVTDSERLPMGSVESNDSDIVDSTTPGMVAALSDESSSLSAEETVKEQDVKLESSPQPEVVATEASLQSPNVDQQAESALPVETLSEPSVSEPKPTEKVVKRVSYKVTSSPEVPRIEEVVQESVEAAEDAPNVAVPESPARKLRTPAKKSEQAPARRRRTAPAPKIISSPSISATVRRRHRGSLNLRRRCACCNPPKKPVDEYEFVDDDEEDFHVEHEEDDEDMQMGEDSDSDGSWREEVVDDSPSPPPSPVRSKQPKTTPSLPRIVEVKSGVSSDLLSDDVLRLRCTLDSRGTCVACDQIRKAEDEREMWEQRPVDVPDSAAEEVLDWLDTIEPIIAAPLPEFTSTTPPLYSVMKAENFALIENRIPAEMADEVVVAVAKEKAATDEEEINQSVYYLDGVIGKVVRPLDPIENKAKEGEERKTAYKCPLCDSTFKVPIHVATHLWLHHKDPSGFDFHCKHCTLNFARKSTVIRHVLHIKYFGGYPCNLGKTCKQKFLTFPTKEELEAHKRDEHGFTCDVCGQWIAGLMYKKSHMARHARQEDKLKLKREKAAEKRQKRLSMTSRVRAPKPPKSPKRKSLKSGGETTRVKPSMPILERLEGMPSPKIGVARKGVEVSPEKPKKKRGRRSKAEEEEEEKDEDVESSELEKHDLQCSCCNKIFKNKQAFSLHQYHVKKTMRANGELPESDEEIDEAEMEKNPLYCKCCKKVYKHKQALSLHRNYQKRKGGSEFVPEELDEEQEETWQELQRLIEEEEENELMDDEDGDEKGPKWLSEDEETSQAIRAVEAAYSSSSGATSPIRVEGDVFEGLVGRDGHLVDLWKTGLSDPNQVRLQPADEEVKVEIKEEEEKDEEGDDDEDLGKLEVEEEGEEEEEETETAEDDEEEEDEEEMKNIAWMQVVDIESALMRAEEEREAAENGKTEEEDDDYEGLYIHEGDISDGEDNDPEEGEVEELPEAPRVFVFDAAEGEVDVIGLQHMVYKDEPNVRPICIADFRSLVLGDETMQNLDEAEGEEIVIHGFP